MIDEGENGMHPVKKYLVQVGPHEVCHGRVPVVGRGDGLC